MIRKYLSIHCVHSQPAAESSPSCFVCSRHHHKNTRMIQNETFPSGGRKSPPPLNCLRAETRHGHDRCRDSSCQAHAVGATIRIPCENLTHSHGASSCPEILKSVILRKGAERKSSIFCSFLFFFFGGAKKFDTPTQAVSPRSFQREPSAKNKMPNLPGLQCGPLAGKLYILSNKATEKEPLWKAKALKEEHLYPAKGARILDFFEL